MQGAFQAIKDKTQSQAARGDAGTFIFDLSGQEALE
jgi:hypothetical protein